MPFFTDLNTYLHQSSLLLQAYPSTTRITTKYSLPRKPTEKQLSKAQSKPAVPKAESDAAATTKRDPAATLILKTFETDSGICLKYKTDKAAEVGRLMTGLGRLAGGEVIEMPTAVAAGAGAEAEPHGVGEKMEVDGGSDVAAPKVEEKTVAGGGGGKAKKKKGKK